MEGGNTRVGPPPYAGIQNLNIHSPRSPNGDALTDGRSRTRRCEGRQGLGKQFKF